MFMFKNCLTFVLRSTDALVVLSQDVRTSWLHHSRLSSRSTRRHANWALVLACDKCPKGPLGVATESASIHYTDSSLKACFSTLGEERESWAFPLEWFFSSFDVWWVFWHLRCKPGFSFLLVLAANCTVYTLYVLNTNWKSCFWQRCHPDLINPAQTQCSKMHIILSLLMWSGWYCNWLPAVCSSYKGQMATMERGSEHL